MSACKKLKMTPSLLMSEDDVNYLCKKFPSMDDSLRTLLESSLSWYQDKIKNIAEESEDESEIEENEDYFNDREEHHHRNDDEYRHDYDDYQRLSPTSLSPWFRIMNKGLKADFLIKAMIEKDGKEFLMKNIFDKKDTSGVKVGILNFAIFNGSSFDLVDAMLDAGGKELLLEQINVLEKIVDNYFGFSNPLVVEKIIDLCPSTLFTCYKRDPAEEMFEYCEFFEGIVSAVIRGGKEVVMMQNEFTKQSILHVTGGDEDYLTRELLEVGGKELLFLKDREGATALRAPISDLLLQTGGKDLVMHQDNEGNTILQQQSEHGLPWTESDFVKVLEVGGRDLLLVRNLAGRSTLHFHCDYHSGWDDHSGWEEERINIIQLAIQLGGKDLVRMKDKHGVTALHFECARKSSSLEVVDQLLEVSIAELGVAAKSKSIYKYYHARDEEYLNPLQCAIMKDDNLTNMDVLLYLLVKGIKHNIGGKYGIGGLFQTNSSSTNNKIFERWSNIVLPLFRRLQDKDADLLSSQPLLEAVILAKAPSNVIRSIIKHVHYLSDAKDTNKKKRRRAINIGADLSLGWDKGMREVIELDQSRFGSVIEERDEESGLYPFMLAASGTDSDLNVVFELARRYPSVVKKFK